MTHPENTLNEHRRRCLTHTARASDVGYAFVQELSQLIAELAPHIAEPFVENGTADDAYVHVLAALRAAYTATHHVTALAAVLDQAGWAVDGEAEDADEPITRLQVVHAAGSAIGVGF